MNKKQIILLIITVIWVAFIFGNSLQTGPVSNSASGFFSSLIYNLLEKIGIEAKIENINIFVRKGAHIFEYAVLGILVSFLFCTFEEKLRYILIYGISSSLLISIIDEFIQTKVEARSGSFVDVAIDAIGFVLSVSITVLIKYLKKVRKVKS